MHLGGVWDSQEGDHAPVLEQLEERLDLLMWRDGVLQLDDRAISTHHEVCKSAHGLARGEYDARGGRTAQLEAMLVSMMIMNAK